jgi:polyhydroxyalkanoate synthesis repressor PhaR
VAAVLIKKYGNRRLYDTGDSRYVTLDELAAKIRGGAELRIIDAQSGEDLTQATLTQIVLETGHAAKFLPVQLLTQMIRLSDDALAEFFSRYVTGALDLYLQAKRGVQSIASYNPLAQLPIAATDALARMWMGSPFGGYAPPAGYPQGYPQYPPGAQGFAPPPMPYPPDEEGDGRRRRDSDTDVRRRDSDTDVRRRADTDTDVRRRPSDTEVELSPRAATEPDARGEDVAAMRRELDELKAALRESLPKKRKRKP